MIIASRKKYNIELKEGKATVAGLWEEKVPKIQMIKALPPLSTWLRFFVLWKEMSSRTALTGND